MKWVTRLSGTCLVLCAGCIPVDLMDLSLEGGTDADGDGVVASEDCDDGNPAIFPQAEEVCDGLDNNCDESIDEGFGGLLYLDDDEDGYGVDGSTIEGCTLQDGYALEGGDCDDADAAAYPGAPELCNGGIDDDCDPWTDEDAAAYADGDGDGFGLPGASSVPFCEAVAPFALLAGDCDDTNPAIHPALVDDDGAQTPPGVSAFTTIQSGIDATDNCSVVQVRAGQYVGAVTIATRSGLQVLGIDGAISTVLTSEDGLSAVSISGSTDILLTGVTVSNMAPSADFGGGIRVESSQRITFQGLAVMDNAVGSEVFGGGIGVRNSIEVKILDSYFARNEANEGGALAVDASSVSVLRSVFDDNEGFFGGAAIGIGDLATDSGPSTVDVRESYFYRNEATQAGGAIGAYQGSKLSVERSYFEDNVTTAEFGFGTGGGAVYNPALIEECYFVRNRSGAYGGALMLGDSALVRSTIFWYNEAGLSGGAINLFGEFSAASYSVITQNTFVNNEAPAGSAVYYYDADDLHVYNNIFYDAVTEVSILCSLEFGRLKVEYNDFYHPAGRDDLFCLDTEDDFIPGTGNIRTDPLFRVLTDSGALSDQDLHLKDESPAKGTGRPESNGSRFDMGAYSGPAPLTWVPTL